MQWLNIVELLMSFVLTIAASRYYWHMLQLQSYQFDGYRRWQNENKAKLFGWTFKVGLIAVIANWLLPVLVTVFTNERSDSTVISHILIWAFVLIYSAKNIFADYKTNQKKKLVFTKRMNRLVYMECAIAAAALALLWLITSHLNTLSGYYTMYVSPFALLAAVPWLITLAAICIEPIEKKINRSFFVAAQQKLTACKGLIKIGITGSYGKTSTKFILATLLSEKYKVLASPSSINTPMGLSKLINEKFTPDTQIFIAEMGARHVGDITELVELVHPTVGLITSIGPQHLETFGNIETVASTKNELIKGLPKNGKAFFASDDAWVDTLYQKAACAKFLTGTGSGTYDFKAEDIEVGAFGCRFTLKTADGEARRCEMTLLGIHNISNVLLCCAVAKELGLTLDEIAAGLKRLKPVEHRLQVLPGRLNIIDDAFNSNPRGSKEALNILKAFPGKHLVITPGMVEMGADEDKFNYEFGEHIAKTCDAVILVGPKHTAPIRKALVNSGFSMTSVKTVKTLKEASALINTLVSDGDSVLFENDLPDNYNE